MWRGSVHGISFHSFSVRASSWICSQLLTHVSKWTPCISLVNVNVTPFGSFWIRICTDSLARVLLLISVLDYSVIEVTKKMCFLYSEAYIIIKRMSDLILYTFTTDNMYRYTTFTSKFKNMLSVLKCSMWFLFSHISKIISVTGAIIIFEGKWVLNLLVHDFKISCHIIKYINFLI
jgi:hypothetical protein